MSLAIDSGHLPPRPIDAAERALRIDLAAAYRLVALRGWDDLIYTHLTARVPNDPECFLINPFGLRFDEVTASNLVKIDGQGRIVGDSPHPVNAIGFRIHATVHAARSDAHCVMHLHHVNGIAVSAQAAGLRPLSQHAMRFHGQVGYHDYEGLALTAAEGARLAASLCDKPALFLRNHGTLVVGRTVAEAFVLMDTLDRACDIQLKAQAGGVPLVTPGPAVLEKTLRQLTGDDAPEGGREWPALLRLLDKTDPTYRD
ncbi:MAG: class II aldolase/adducin family protein [Gammaproteobacteria bacterium]|nr:class II aldolase/adducin family protein [Gammaproteobacteria bacterium]MBU1646114.1 class II aldolase/adducin family protein [Gammaproteobacteria bacterium]MBU1972176.1 class II aldolase/adducin family protein [Gammaproteobacteria bacterium]